MKRRARQSITYSAVFLLLSPHTSLAALVFETEPNNTLATAQPVGGHFSLDHSLDIGNGTHVDNTSLTIPHVTVRGTGNGSYDYYSFYFPGAGSTAGQIILDIDHTASGFDSRVALWSSSGLLLGHNDDYDYRGGAGGSTLDYSGTQSFDSLMATSLIAPGTYIVGVGRSGSSPEAGGFIGASIGAVPQSGDSYELQISVENVPVVPEPATYLLFSAGALAVLARRYRARKA